MGLGIYEEFTPPTPIKITSRSTVKFPEPEPGKELRFNEDNECRTPKSASSVLAPPPVCPPAPVKPQPPRRKRALATGCFYRVPEDLASLFVSISGCNKKLRTC